MNQKDINRNSYNSIVSEWASYRKQTTINTCIKEFCELLPNNGRVLDIGCGTGYPIDDYLSRNGFSVVGIDICEKMIEEAKTLKLPNAEFYVKDFVDFTGEDKFDAVIAFDSIWHIEESQQEYIYKAVADLLQPNGYFIFTHGKKQGTVSGNMFSYKFIYSALDANDVRRLLQENSMDIVLWQEDYEEETTGTRELLVIAKKVV